MDINKLPNLKTLTIEQAKSYIIEQAAATAKNGNVQDINIEIAGATLADAVLKREAAEQFLAGSRSYQTFGSNPHLHLTEVLYEAAWQLVLEGRLRPAPRACGEHMTPTGGFCLTNKAKDELGLK